MTLSTVALPVRLRRGALRSGPAEATERWVRRRVAIAWGLLVLDVLPFSPRTWTGAALVVPIPSILGKMIAQGALPAALLVALSVNRRLLVRPNIFLCLVSLIVIEAFLLILEPQHIGTIYRTFRFGGFVTTIWLLTPWWGRRDLLLVRSHLTALLVVLGTVLVGVPVKHHSAFGESRLTGALWPIPPPQVAHIAAVATGLVVVLWLGGLMSGRATVVIVLMTVASLLLTHTRTALVGMLAGIIVAGLSLFKVRARARKLFASLFVIVSIGALTLSGVVTTYLARGENTQQLTDLTGRTNVWSQILTAPRDEFQVFFGFGLSNLSFNGLSVDSNWLGSYLDLGLVGVALTALLLLFVLVAAFLQPPGVRRALALFLVAYCLVSSFTETGLSDPSMYLLDLSVAASLLVPPITNRSPG
jgi:O-Antigen ligase